MKLILDDLKNDPYSYLKIFIYIINNYERIDDYNDLDAIYQKLGIVRTMLEQIEEACGKGNYAFDYSTYFDAMYMDEPGDGKFWELIIYDIALVDFDALNECFNIHAHLFKTMILTLHTTSSILDLSAISGEFSKLTLIVPQTTDLVFPTIEADQLLIDASMLENFSIEPLKLTPKSFIKILSKPLNDDLAITFAKQQYAIVFHPGTIIDLIRFIEENTLEQLWLKAGNNSWFDDQFTEPIHYYITHLNYDRLRMLCEWIDNEIFCLNDIYFTIQESKIFRHIIYMVDIKMREALVYTMINKFEEFNPSFVCHEFFEQIKYCYIRGLRKEVLETKKHTKIGAEDRHSARLRKILCGFKIDLKPH